MIQQMSPMTSYGDQQPLAGMPPSRSQIIAALMGNAGMSGKESGGGAGPLGGLNPMMLAQMMPKGKGSGVPSAGGGVAPNAMDYGAIANGANAGAVPGAVIY